MIKIFYTILFLMFSLVGFSQEKSEKLTDAEKDELRKNHNSTLTFTTKKKATITALSTSNTKEQDAEEVKTTTTVKYYYGKEDSLFKEFKYKKTEE